MKPQWHFNVRRPCDRMRDAPNNQPELIHTMINQTDRLLWILGQDIQSRRKSMRLTQAGLAKEARISPTHLSAIECGERSVSLLCLSRIAKALHTTVKALCEAMEERTRQI